MGFFHSERGKERRLRGHPGMEHSRADSTWRHSLAAREIGERTHEPISVINVDGRHGAKMLAALGFSTDPLAALRIIPGPFALHGVPARNGTAQDRFSTRPQRRSGTGSGRRSVMPHTLFRRRRHSGRVGVQRSVRWFRFAACVGETCRGVFRQRLPWRDLRGNFWTTRLNLEHQSLVDEAHARASRHLSFNAVAAQLSSFYEQLATD